MEMNNVNDTFVGYLLSKVELDKDTLRKELGQAIKKGDGRLARKMGLVTILTVGGLCGLLEIARRNYEMVDDLKIRLTDAEHTISRLKERLNDQEE
jgi:hypothetical protein